MSVSDFLKLGIASPSTNQNTDNSRLSYSSQYTSTYSPISNVTDNRQLTLIMSSPYASSESKKADKSDATSSPYTSPSLSNTPNLSGSSNADASTGQPSILGSLFGGSNTLLIAGLIVGGAILLSRRK